MNRSRYGGRESPPTTLPSRSNSMTSPRSTSTGASERDSRKRVGFPGWRTLTWPYASTPPSLAMSRLAMTTSRAARSSSVTVSPPSRNTSAEGAGERDVAQGEPEPRDQGRHFGHVLDPRGLVRSALEAPVLIASGAPGVGVPEHVEPPRIPPIDRRLRRGPALLGADHLTELHVPVAHVRRLLLEDPRQRPVEREIGAADELLELILAHAVDQEAERGDVGPGRHRLSKGFEVAPRSLDVHQLRGVVTELVQQPVDLAEVVDLLAGDLGQHPLIVGRRRRPQPQRH